MSRVTPVSAKKRKLEEAMRGKTGGKPKKRIRKQKHYHSSSSEDEEGQDIGFAPVNLLDSDEEAVGSILEEPKKSKKPAEVRKAKVEARENRRNTRQTQDATSSSEADGPENTEVVVTTNLVEAKDSPADTSSEAGSGSDAVSSGSDTDSDAPSESATSKPSKKRSKRNDPDAFSTSISKILSTKLPTSVRHDPVLSRSLDASKARQEASDERLEAKARAQIRADKQSALQKGRTTDVLGIERGIAGEVAEKEKGLRKIAQKGVIQLFNAFRAAHVRAEEARKEERRKGTVGMGERERKVNEVSKEGFLELIGGKKKSVAASSMA